MVRVWPALLCLMYAIADQTVFDKNLVKSRTTFKDILDHASQPNLESAQTKFYEGGPSLAYVTPWNNRGYDVVKEFKGKFDFVSPVWYTLKQTPNGMELQGGHDVDPGWMDQVRGTVDDREVGKIVPRFQLDSSWQKEHYEAIISSVENAKLVSQLLADECEQQGFDGLLLETGIPQYLKMMLSFLSRSLKEKGRLLIVVVAPSSAPSNIIQDMDFVDYFSLMTYDHASHIGKIGPNAPIEWMEDQIVNYGSSTKLLLGLNMYGMDYVKSANRGEPILGNKVLEILKEHRPVIHYDKDVEEHYFEYSDKGHERIIYYPSLKSLEARLRLAEDYELGLSLWEVGQGLDYFYDLF